MKITVKMKLQLGRYFCIKCLHSPPLIVKTKNVEKIEFEKKEREKEEEEEEGSGRKKPRGRKDN